MRKFLRCTLPFGLALMLALGGSVHASATDRPSQGRVRTFEAQARPVKSSSMSAAATGPCWRWSGSWGWENAVGKLMYGFRETVEWCANARRTKVSSLLSNICANTGGYFDYLGCNKQKESLGLSSLHIVDTWHYRFGCCGAYITADPSVDAYFYPDGRVSGTVYYDNP